jgi:ATP-dependent RNA helicase RhlB
MSADNPKFGSFRAFYLSNNAYLTLTETTDTKATDTKATDPKAKADNSANSKRRNSSSRGGRRRGRGRGGNKKWTVDQFVVEPQEGKVRFHDFDLPLPLLRGVQSAGFSYCTPIQGASLPHTLRGHDMVGKAQTGTGKTAAFLISTISDLINHPIEDERYMGEARALILAPTRELAIQIGEDAEQLVQHTDLKVHTLVGGMDYAKQLQKMQKKHCDILVGTPGRLMDFANNKDIHLDQVEVLVIDEADRMLDMGFIPQVRRLVRLTPPREDRQTLLFSATFTPEVLRLSEQWTDKPVMLEMEPERVATDTVEQKIFITTASEKFNLLQNILRDEAVDSVMVFANRRDICRTLYERLKKQGFRVGLIAGDVPQNRRMKTLESFKNGSLKVMVATDVAGRGIHVNGVSHVVNFTLPEEPEDYVHRIGRTGRAGQTGISVSFACEDDAFLLEPIEKLLDMKLPCTMPDEALLADVPAPVRKRPPAAKKDAPAADTSSPKAVKEEPASKEPVSKKPVSKEPAAKDTVEAELVEETPVEEKSAEVKPLEEKAVEEQPVQDEPSKSEPVEEQQSPKQAQEKPE